MTGKSVAQIIVETLQDLGIKHCYEAKHANPTSLHNTILNSTIEVTQTEYKDIALYAAHADSYLNAQLTVCMISGEVDDLDLIRIMIENQNHSSPILIIINLSAQDKLVDQHEDRTAQIKMLYQSCSVFYAHVSQPISVQKTLGWHTKQHYKTKESLSSR